MSDLQAPFDEMSKQIQANAGSFGGACVIVFPTAGNTIQIDPIALMMLDAKGDVAQFLSTLMTRLAMVKDEIEHKSRPTGFGAR